MHLLTGAEVHSPLSIFTNFLGSLILDVLVGMYGTVFL